jgi:lipid-A-disaccharide synthase
MSEEIRSSKKNIKIAIIAGEKSGDQLGGPLMEAIKIHYPNAEFIGVGGDSMKKQGLNSFFNMEDIAVMGIIEPLLSLRKILRLRRDVNFFFKNQNPSLFIGIDSPDFNLPIAKFLKNELNIKTVQYVSPSVWAWRKGRIKKMEKSIDAVFTLFPFEKEAYKNSSIEAYFIGHPLAYKIQI